MAKVWNIQIRIFHWVFAVLIGYALVSSGITEYFGLRLLHTDPLLASHIAAGTAVFALTIFRIYWGFKGSRYSRFSALILEPYELARYIKAVFKKERLFYTGHNPAASWFGVATIGLSLIIFISGLAVYGIDEDRGLLGFLHTDYHMYSGALKLVHGFNAMLLLIAIVIHVSGVALETARHGPDTAKSMLTGSKQAALNEELRVSSSRTKAGLLSIILVLAPFIAAITVYASINAYEPDETAIPEVYKEECASCHMAYTPNMLPARSWRAMMANLEDHFGEDATIEGAEKAEIEDYLTAGAAEKSLQEFSIKFSASIRSDKAPLSATEIGYWKRKHDLIKPEVYKRESIKSKANCAACHKWAERGSYEDNDIRIPRY
ncbi:MAG: cytochrome b/b6 domain-containing protein [Dissulfurispiraceae bacterium]|jgi:cytochrome b|nr:cytochrome b/b6 domain-containing protein [Dissulfurispiraceae bacterium]